jgi:hypothetical protein
MPCAAPCHWLDLRPTPAGHHSEYLLTDTVPTAAGAEAAAAAIWSTMERYGVAQ